MREWNIVTLSEYICHTFRTSDGDGITMKEAKEYADAIIKVVKWSNGL